MNPKLAGEVGILRPANRNLFPTASAIAAVGIRTVEKDGGTIAKEAKKSRSPWC